MTPPPVSHPEHASSRRRRGPPPELLWRAQTLAALVVAAWIGLKVVPQLHGAMEWASYRSAMHALVGTVRAMRVQAMAQRRVIELRVDATRGAFQLAAIDGSPRRYETLERTIWLPKELKITEAPAALTALPTGSLSSSSILISAPAFNKLFRVTTNPDGRVQLNEEPEL